MVIVLEDEIGENHRKTIVINQMKTIREEDGVEIAGIASIAIEIEIVVVVVGIMTIGGVVIVTGTIGTTGMTVIELLDRATVLVEMPTKLKTALRQIIL